MQLSILLACCSVLLAFHLPNHSKGRSPQESHRAGSGEQHFMPGAAMGCDATRPVSRQVFF